MQDTGDDVARLGINIAVLSRWTELILDMRMCRVMHIDTTTSSQTSLYGYLYELNRLSRDGVDGTGEICVPPQEQVHHVFICLPTYYCILVVMTERTHCCH